jgi:hypothetical protein
MEDQQRLFITELSFTCGALLVAEIIWLASFINVKDSATDAEFPLLNASLEGAKAPKSD